MNRALVGRASRSRMQRGYVALYSKRVIPAILGKSDKTEICNISQFEHLLYLYGGAEAEVLRGILPLW